MGCTLLLGGVLVLSPVSVAARQAPLPTTAGPADGKELQPQAKEGDPEPRGRPVPAGVLPPKQRRRVVSTRRVPRSLETDPVDVIPLPLDRDRFIWPASPRLRTGAWFAVHGLVARSVRFRQYEPEIVYEKKHIVLMTEVGGAVRLNRFELSVSVPLVGQLGADFYQKGLVDHTVAKLDRVDLSITTKAAFRFRRKKSIFLLTPYISLGVPSGSRELYSTNIGGRTVEHFTAGPLAVSVLPGLAAGWRRGMFSAVLTVGILTRVGVRRLLRDDEEIGPTTASWIAAYQFAFAPWRDIVLVLTLSHVHQLLHRTKDGSEDAYLFSPGIRFQPWAGLFGHVGVSIPIGKPSFRFVPKVITLCAGYEFQ